MCERGTYGLGMLPHIEDLGFRVQRCGGFRDITSYIGFGISAPKKRHIEKELCGLPTKKRTPQSLYPSTGQGLGLRFRI